MTSSLQRSEFRSKPADRGSTDGPPPHRSTSEDLKDRILDEFGRRAAVSGIRAVVMAQLAAALGISTKTLYGVYRTKDELVRALLARWAENARAEQSDRIAQIADPVVRLQEGACALAASRRSLCEDFWHDLAVDHPGAHTDLGATLRELRHNAESWVRPLLSPDIDPRLARAAFDALVSLATNPGGAPTGIGHSDDTVRALVALWAHGALRTDPVHPAAPREPSPAQRSPSSPPTTGDTP